MGTHIRLWLAEIRANFLVLPVVLVAIGGAAAWRDGVMHPARFVLTLLGVVAAHASVNLFNNFSDWRSGIDSHTSRTPFSGGSGNLPAGLLDPVMVRIAAWATLAAAFCAGLYLASVAGWPVLAIMALGGFATVFYTDLLTRLMLGELTSGLTLGSLVVIGAYLVQTGTIAMPVVWVSVPPGILTTQLLLLNEFPDVEADRAGGRRHMVILLGAPAAAIVYAILMGCVYVSIVAGAMTGVLPAGTLAGLATVPLAAMTSYRAVRYAERIDRLLPALGMNVVVVLATDALLAIGFLIS